jgi:hypothetical protein
VVDNNLAVKSRLFQKVKQDLDMTGSFATADGKKDGNMARKGETGRETHTHTQCWWKTSMKKATSKW